MSSTFVIQITVSQVTYLNVQLSSPPSPPHTCVDWMLTFRYFFSCILHMTGSNIVKHGLMEFFLYVYPCFAIWDSSLIFSLIFLYIETGNKQKGNFFYYKTLYLTCFIPRTIIKTHSTWVDSVRVCKVDYALCIFTVVPVLLCVIIVLISPQMVISFTPAWELPFSSADMVLHYLLFNISVLI